MRSSWRRLVGAAAVCLIVTAGVAGAQTVIVQNAPPKSTLEVLLNDKAIGSATADARGMATVATRGVAKETSAHVFVDVCGDRRRVILVEPGLQPAPAEPACSRKEISGLFVVRPITTFVVDVGGPAPEVWLRQGAAPESWLRPQTAGAEPSGPERTAPTGLILSAGGSLVDFADIVTKACGNAAQCASRDFRAGFSAALAYWFNPYLGAEVSVAKPALATANGGDTTYSFDNSLDARMLTLVGKVGVPVGAIRLYGEGGINYHRATASTTETVNDLTVTVGGVSQTVPGGTQSWNLTTAGWGWLFGGGFEGWVTNYAAIYAEVTFGKLKGSGVDGAEGTIDDGLTSIMAGVRVHVGR